MNFLMKTLLVLGIAAAGGAVALYSGVYDVAADVPHTRPVYAVLEFARERSIAARAGKLDVPADLDDAARIRQGAGNYEAMCSGCHLKPGAAPTELSRGLYPAPPDLSRTKVSPAAAFWVVKHGIKASGMPAWGRSMDDAYLWNMVAFLQRLPTLDRAAYDALVASSEGHSHGGGESGAHAHSGGGHDHHDETPHEHDDADAESSAPAAQGTTHVHADGKTHVHAPESAPADDGHSH